jgi:hypothetical protein
LAGSLNQSRRSVDTLRGRERRLHFPGEKVEIELKTLERDARVEHAQKLGGLAIAWGRRGRVRVYGTTVMDLQTIHPECQLEWLDLLENPIEWIFRKANSQIRSTKRRENLPDAKGLLLIPNDGNLLHTAPIVFMNLVAGVCTRRPQRVPRNSQRYAESCISRFASGLQVSQICSGCQERLSLRPIPTFALFRTD